MFKNRIRLPFFISRPQFPVERNAFRRADGSTKLLSAIIRNTYQGQTDYMPEDWHRKLVIALSHDEVTIEDNKYLTDVVLDGDYGIDWQEFLNNPVAPANFQIQVTPFDATNSNCQTCEEVTQLELVDDYTDEIWDEGTTHEFPDILTANDTICCYPFLIELMSFNTSYFDSVTIDSDGVLTATVKDVVPILNDVLIATYRVTCENGGYDEANVYGNITGTSTECPPVTNLQALNGGDGTIEGFLWTEPSPAPAGGYDYYLYQEDDVYTVIQSGNTATDTVTLVGLTPGESYVFVVVSNCGGGDLSDPVQVEFTTPTTGTENCYTYLVTYVIEQSSGVHNFSYLDCAGVVQTYYFTNGPGSVSLCMLTNPGEEDPIYFAASTQDIQFLQTGPC